VKPHEVAPFHPIYPGFRKTCPVFVKPGRGRCKHVANRARMDRVSATTNTRPTRLLYTAHPRTRMRTSGGRHA
jgi:hypothetical protein